MDNYRTIIYNKLQGIKLIYSHSRNSKYNTEYVFEFSVLEDQLLNKDYFAHYIYNCSFLTGVSQEELNNIRQYGEIINFNQIDFNLHLVYISINSGKKDYFDKNYS